MVARDPIIQDVETPDLCHAMGTLLATMSGNRPTTMVTDMARDMAIEVKKRMDEVIAEIDEGREKRKEGEQ